MAALQAELVVLRATVAALRADLGAARALAAAQADAHAIERAAVPPGTALRWLSMDLPVLAGAAPGDRELRQGGVSPVLELALDDTGEIEIVLSGLPEAALLSPRHARHQAVLEADALIDLTGEPAAARRTA
jgi:hypothetical protein